MCHVLNAMLLQKLPSLFPWKHNKTKMMAEPVMEEVANISQEDLKPCKICGRTFLPDPLVKHTRICEKNATKKRKIFNSLRQRVEGTDLELFHQRTYLKKNREPSPPQQIISQSTIASASATVGNVKHNTPTESPSLIGKEMKVAQSIQANRSVESLKPVSSVSSVRKTRSSALMANATFERCPACDRQFGPKAYDRHVEWCKEKMARLPTSSLTNNQVAKERLEMRTKYRVPPINRNKKTVKEKYQMSSSTTTNFLHSPTAISPPHPEVSKVNSRKPSLQRNPSVRHAPVVAMASNQNSTLCNATYASSNRRKSEPLKAKRPTVSILKINATDVNDKSGFMVSNYNTPVSSSSSHCTIQSEPMFQKHPATVPLTLLTCKETSQHFTVKEEQTTRQKSFIKDQHTGRRDNNYFTETIKSPKILVDIELPKISYEQEIDDSDISTEVQETVKEPHITKKDKIDLNYVKTCLDSNNFQMMKLSDAQQLQSNMLLISTKTQSGVEMDDNLYIVINPPKTNEPSASSIKKQSGIFDVNNATGCDCSTKKSPSKIPIRPGLRKSYYSDTNLAKFPITDIQPQDQPEQKNIEISRDTLASNKTETCLFDIACDTNNNNKQCMANVPKFEEIVDNYQNDSILNYVEENPEVVNLLQVDKAPVSNFSSGNTSTKDLEAFFMLAKSDFVEAPTASKNKLVEGNSVLENNQAEGKSKITLGNTKVETTITEDEYINDEEANNLQMEAIPIIELKSKGNKRLFSDIDDSSDDSCASPELNINNKYGPVTQIDEVEEENNNYVDNKISGESILYKHVNRHPAVHSETDFQLRKAREVLNIPPCTDIQQFGDISRFDSYLDYTAIGDLGSPDKEKPETERRYEKDADQGDASNRIMALDDPDVKTLKNIELSELKNPEELAVSGDIPNVIKLPEQISLCGHMHYMIGDNVIFERCGKLSEVESLHGMYYNMYSSVLSKTRLERELRGCCSEMTLNFYNSDSSQMVTASETDLLKFNHLQEMMRNHYEEQNAESNDKLENNLLSIKISQGTQPDVNFDRNECVQTDAKKEKQIGEHSTNTVRKEDENTIENKPLINLQEGKNDESNEGEIAKVVPKSYEVNVEKDKETRDKDVPFATRIYQNCLHHNIIKIKLRKTLQNKQEYPLKETPTQFTVMKTPSVKLNTKASPLESNASESTHSIARSTNSYNTDAEITDSESSTVSKLSPRFQTLVDVILHENRSEVFRLTRRDCKRLIKLNPKKIGNKSEKSASGTKFPKITMVMPKANVNETTKRLYKSTVHTLPRITESTNNNNKNNIINNNNRSSKSNPSIPITTNNTSNTINTTKPDNTYNPFVTAERQLMELLECDDFKHLNNNKNKQSLTKDNNPLHTMTSNKSKSPTMSEPLSSSTPKQKKRKSLVESPSDFKDIANNPQDDIDFELLENFINDNFGNDELMHKLDLDTISLASCSTKTDNTISFYDDISIDPRLINDFDNLSIPDNLQTETTTPDMIRQYPLVHSNRFRLDPLDQKIRNRNTSISSDSSFADMSSTPTINIQENKKKMNLQRTLFTDPVKHGKNLKSRNDVQRYFDEEDSNSPRDNADIKDDNREFDMVAAAGTEELFSVDDEMYEEYKKYEEMYLLEKEEQLKREAEMRANEDSSNNMISADSAYGSLNRSGKTKVRSKITKLSPMEPAHLDSASSSGSDTCIMQTAPEHSTPMNANVMTSFNTNSATGTKNNSKLSKFCHECGNRYPLSTAKFCVECGVRRLHEGNNAIASDDDERDK